MPTYFGAICFLIKEVFPAQKVWLGSSSIVPWISTHMESLSLVTMSNIRFTDGMNRDLYVIYAELEDNDDEDDPIPQVDGLAGVYNSDDDEDEDYNTESDSLSESDSVL